MKNFSTSDLSINSEEKTQIIIKSELIAVLYRNFPINFVAIIVTASILFWPLLDVIGRSYIISWYIAFWGVSLLRLAAWVWFTRTCDNPNLLSYHYNVYLITSSCTALLWGGLGSVLMPDDVGYQALILIIICGSFAGAVQSLAADYKICVTYVLLALIPILIWELLQAISGSVIYLTVFISTILYTFFALVIGHRYYAILVNNIKLNLKNTELFNDLKKYTSEIELLSEVETLLATCNTAQEVCDISGQFISQLLPFSSGGIYLAQENSNKLKAIKTWGKTLKLSRYFADKNCYAMVFNHLHEGEGHESCPHYPKNVAFHICIPLRLPEKIYGVLTVAYPHSSEISNYNQSMLIRIANDITAVLTRLHLRDALESKAMQDFLTGLYNKRYLSEYLKMELNRAKRKRVKVAVLMLDLDHFKRFNDQFGHEIGDAVLQKTGAFLKDNTRKYDTACRYGGEEFTVIMSHASLETAYQRAEMMRQGIKSLSVLNNNEEVGNITLSIGVAVYPDHGSTVEEVLEAADQALYQAKRQGRDRVCVASDLPRSNTKNDKFMRF